MNAILKRNDKDLSVSVTDEFLEQKEQALASSALVAKVSNALQNDRAVQAMKSLKELTSAVEKHRKLIKQPVLDYGRKIDTTAKAAVKELDAEFNRIAQLTANFQELEKVKARAAEAARLKELAEAEREREKAIAAAKTEQEIDNIQEEFCQRQAELPKPVEPVKAEGQVVKTDWEIEIVDLHHLARCHPTCVRIEPRLLEIKERLNNGLEVAGINAKKVTKASVRTGRRQEVIEI